MKRESISERDQKALLFLAMLAIGALAFFIGFQWFLKSASVTKVQNAELEIELRDLQEKDRNKEETEKKKEQYEKDTEEIANQYPSMVTEEKVFYDFYKLQEGLGKTHFTSVYATMNGLYYPAPDGTTATESTEDANTDNTTGDDTNTDDTNTDGSQTADEEEEKHGFTYDGTVTVFNTEVKTQVKDMSYTALKQLIKTVAIYDGRLTIDSMNLKFSKESGLLEGEIVFEMYALDGSPKLYKEPQISGVPSGVKNIFGTFDAK